MEPPFRDDELISSLFIERIKSLVKKIFQYCCFSFFTNRITKKLYPLIVARVKVSFFNMFYCGENIINGEWERVEKYLSTFTRPYDIENTCLLFLKLQNQKHRENRQPSWNVTAASERANLLHELKTLVEKNPKLQEKLMLPRLNGSALFHLMKRIFPSPK